MGKDLKQNRRLDSVFRPLHEKNDESPNVQYHRATNYATMVEASAHCGVRFRSRVSERDGAMRPTATKDSALTNVYAVDDHLALPHIGDSGLYHLLFPLVRPQVPAHPPAAWR